MSDINDMLQEAIKIGTNVKYRVVVDELVEEMTYIQLGTYLVSCADNIKEVEIKLKK